MEDTDPIPDVESQAKGIIDDSGFNEILETTVFKNDYIPKMGGSFPSVKQALALGMECPELLLAGETRSGKTYGMFAAALQYVNFSNYKAIIFRNSLTDMSLPGSLMYIARQWLENTDATYDRDEFKWTFPSGAVIQFGYMKNAGDEERYQGTEMHFIAFDELTHFTEAQYSYMFTRLWKSVQDPIPLRIRATANPGGRGLEWIYNRFVLYPPPTCMILDMSTTDNPASDPKSYRDMVATSGLDAVRKQQLLHGNWSLRHEGNIFRSQWFKFIPMPPPHDTLVRIGRAWDLAATAPNSANPDPDWTAGCKFGRDAFGRFYAMDLKPLRGDPGEVERLIRSCANEDGVETTVLLELQPGAAGKREIEYYKNTLLPDRNVEVVSTQRGFRMPGGEGNRKVNMAKPLAAAMSRGLVMITRNEVMDLLVNQLLSFPQGSHDDFVDAASMAFNYVMDNQYGAAEPPIIPSKAAIYRSDKIVDMGNYAGGKAFEKMKTW